MEKGIVQMDVKKLHGGSLAEFKAGFIFHLGPKMEGKQLSDSRLYLFKYLDLPDFHTQTWIIGSFGNLFGESKYLQTILKIFSRKRKG